jgi:tyrosyl-tRNA synthetase
MNDLLTHNIDAVLPRVEELDEKLKTGDKLTVYAGFDPTGEHLHIGHALQLMKLKEFQEAGHRVIMLIGSFTAMIGDPTDKGAARTRLTKEEVMANAKTYQEQAAKILSFEGENAAELKFNDEWLAKLSMAEVIDLASHFTVQQMAERDMFARRIEEGKPVYMHEFMYPLMQGYDSVAMDVDVEIGGSDQLFNMLAGRTLQKQINGKEKFVMTLSLLTNDEGKKMSKSEGGFIALDDAPEDKYGKIMAMADSMIAPYAKALKIELETDVEADPRGAKAELARGIVSLFDSSEDATKAEEHFNTVFRSNELPEDMPEFKLEAEMSLVDLLVATELCSSKSDARRQIAQGAVKIDSEPESDEHKMYAPGASFVLQKGKRHFVRIV